ncbi:MAG: hypothetical protein JW806_00725 [Sedimentisphaerales bacterium]|nr:hypothetical protein [Sedimentisphaerales bacterium]
MTASKKIFVLYLFLSAIATVAVAELPQSQMQELYRQANESFRQANSAQMPDEAEKLYKNAILNFEKVIDAGRIENAKLYYNLANAYFLTGQLGKAVLNYRKAEKLDDSDQNIKKNLAFARSKKTDKIIVKTEKKVLHTLFFWHYDFSLKAKFLLTCIFFGAFCLCIAGTVWFGRNTVWITPAIICSILTLSLLVSVIIEYRVDINNVCGVIIDAQVTARQGDGENYPPSFKEPLHEGTEFELLEKRPGWFYIKLADDSVAWIPENSAELI